MRWLTAQIKADKHLLDGVCTKLAGHKTASQNRVSTYSKELEKLLADKVVVETKFSKYWVEAQAILIIYELP